VRMIAFLFQNEEVGNVDHAQPAGAQRLQQSNPGFINSLLNKKATSCASICRPISQNRMRAIAETKADLDLQISLLSEHEITRLLQLVSHIAEKLDIGEGGAPDLAELKREVAPKG
jgi:uncharacterized membrane protein